MLQQNNNVEIGTEICIATAKSFYALATCRQLPILFKNSEHKEAKSLIVFGIFLHCGK